MTAHEAEPLAPAEAAPAPEPRRVGPPRPPGEGWRSAAREFAVIVAGVLVALGAQAWWDGREERGRERDYLRQLLADTRENEARLNEAIRVDSAAGVDAARLVAAFYTPGPPPPPDSLAALFRGHAFSASEFQPVAGTYEALLVTGDLRLVRSDSLRGALVAYAARLASERERLQFFLEQGFGEPAAIVRAVPFLARSFFGVADADDAAGLARLRGDPDLAAVLFAVRVANRNRLVHLEGIRDETRDLLRVLEAEPALRQRAE